MALSGVPQEQRAYYCRWRTRNSTQCTESRYVQGFKQRSALDRMRFLAFAPYMGWHIARTSSLHRGGEIPRRAVGECDQRARKVLLEPTKRTDCNLIRAVSFTRQRTEFRSPTQPTSGRAPVDETGVTRRRPFRFIGQATEATSGSIESASVDPTSARRWLSSQGRQRRAALP